MDISKKISDIGENFVGFNITNGCAYVQLNFPKTWTFPSEEYMREEYGTEFVQKNGDETYFYGDADNYEKVFDAALYTIEMNKSIEAKIALLQVKVTELKELFADKDLEELKTLQFVTTPPKSKAIADIKDIITKSEISKPKNKKKNTKKEESKKDKPEKKEEPVIVEEVKVEDNNVSDRMSAVMEIVDGNE